MHMKRFFVILATTLSLCSCSVLGGINWNAEGLASAAGKAATAASISDDMVVELSRQTIAQMDAQSVIDHGAYEQRLSRVLSGLKDLDGLPLNFKVYKTKEINAYACGDGSIRERCVPHGVGPLFGSDGCHGRR